MKKTTLIALLAVAWSVCCPATARMSASTPGAGLPSGGGTASVTTSLWLSEPSTAQTQSPELFATLQRMERPTASLPLMLLSAADENAEAVSAKIEELKAYRDTKVSDELPGYYVGTTAADLNAELERIEVTLADDLSAEERNEQLAALETAKANFDTACASAPRTQPKVSQDGDNHYYVLYTPLRGTRYTTSNGAGNELVGNTAPGVTSYWKFVSRTDGTLDIVNSFDGTFISPASTYNSALRSQAESPANGWTLKAAAELGNLIITSGDVEFNQTESAYSYKVFNWGSGSNTTDKGCQYAIRSVTMREITVNFEDTGGNAIGASVVLLPEGEEITETGLAATVPPGYVMMGFSGFDNDYSVVLTTGGVPQVGGYYYFYNKRQVGNAYFYDNDGAVGFSTAKQVGNEAYIWRCVANGTDKYDMVNLASGRYFSWKALSTSPYGWVIDGTKGAVGVGGVVNDGCVTMKGPNTSDKYMVIKNGNAFDQASRAGYYDATYSSDFMFENCGNDVRFLTVESPAYAKATFRLGEKESSNTFLLTDGTAGELTLVGYSSAYTFDGFYDGDTRIETVDASTITESKTITARFSLNVFSAQFGDKWIRIRWNRDAGYAMGLADNNGEDFAGIAGKDTPLDLSSEEQLWCLIGNNTEGFRLYNRTAGESLALHVSATTDGSAAKLTAATGACLWKIVLQGNSYAITPATNTGMSLNSYGGVGRDLKLYNATDGGGLWNFERVTPGMNLSTVIAGTNPYPTTNYLAGETSFTVDGVTATSRVKAESTEPELCYLPIGATVTLSQNIAYRGFIASGITLDEETAPEVTFTVGDEPRNVVSTFSVDANNEAQYLFYTPSPTNHPYRIPAIATAKNGDVIALNDHRPCGGDIGFGEVDIYCRVSKDNGNSWSEPELIADGTGVGGTVDCGFGDAALCADRERNELLMMCVCGNAFYGSGSTTRSNPNRIARYTAKLNESTGQWEWSTFDKDRDELTEQIYSLFDNGDVNNDGTPDPLQALFIGSGRLYQSKYVKVGEYYRLYAALCARPNGNRVIYSDDFGLTWKALGGDTALPAPGGDEPKCEEMPDGSVILSSRAYGRVFNIFTFTNAEKAEGSWLGAVTSNAGNNGIAIGNSTNGDIMLLNAIRKSDGEPVHLLLQSVPFANERRNVGFFYKEVTEEMYADVTALASNWTKGLQVTDQYSAYSAFTYQHDNRIGFFLEDGPVSSGGYSLPYIPLTIEQITNGEYEVGENPLLTGVKAIKPAPAATPDIYSLSGYKVPAADKGVYIVNGQKVLKK